MVCNLPVGFWGMQGIWISVAYYKGGYRPLSPKSPNPKGVHKGPYEGFYLSGPDLGHLGCGLFVLGYRSQNKGLGFMI